ncbi:flagellar hook-length control protein FliK [Extensimonas sp. H3M7-6]|uniref:flagellar hook-length control protein FliK n=1 Tax=Extensimonas soli TaxID=3031322 RepID=UPI0023DA30D3|nr:flagellar hook-length control protein FliK [Extensimonas sp. H3M7-6]MDF1481939.1 flagellar hook-length control protein FliK [Extensimonas sp. H3M7-6]
MEPARIAPAPHPPSAPQPAQASSDKAAADPKTQAGSQGRGSFAALLLALDGAAMPAAGGAPADAGLAADDGTADAAALADPAALAAWQGVLGGPQVQGMARGAAGGAVGDGAKDAATEGLLAGVGRGSAFDTLSTIAQPHGLVAQTARLDRAADVTDSQGFQRQQGPQALRRTLARSAAQVQAGLVDSAAAQATAAPGATAAHGSHTGADALAAAGPQAAPTDAAGAGARGVDAAPRSDPPSAALQATPATLQTAARDALIAAAAAVSTGVGAAGDGLRAKDRAGDGGAAPQAVAVVGGSTFGSTLQQAAGAVDASAMLADPTQAGAEDRLAQQISYWVHQTTQNAEMTVDQGGAAVQVSVSLTGNEARVHFMTDQAQARALLDANMAQLRELLLGQGLVLTGTSVGTTAQGQGQAAGGQAQGQSASERPGRAQGLVVAAAVNPGGGLRASVDLRRALDVFA